MQLTEEHYSWVEQVFGVNTRPDQAPPSPPTPPTEKSSGGFFGAMSSVVSSVTDAASAVAHGAEGRSKKFVSAMGDEADRAVHTVLDTGAKVADAAVDAAPLPDSVKETAKTYVDFQKGVTEGAYEGAKGLVKGMAHLAGAVAQEASELATSQHAREDALKTVVHGAEVVGSFVGTAVSDPGKAADEVGGAVKGAAEDVLQIGKAVYHSYEEAKMAGHAAEWLGKATGQVSVMVAGAVLTDGASLAGEGVAVAGEDAMLAIDGAKILTRGASLARGTESLEESSTLARGVEEAQQGAKATSQCVQTSRSAAASQKELLEAEQKRDRLDTATQTANGSGSLQHGDGLGESPQAEGLPRERPTSGGRGGNPSPPEPEGLAFRKDLPEHLAGPNGWKGGRLNGTHNSQNAMSELERRGAMRADTLEVGKPGYTVTKTKSPGIDTLDYQVVNPNTGELVFGSKTAYDPALYADEQMVEMSQQAGTDAFSRFKLNSSTEPETFDTQVGNVTMRSYINFDPITNEPYVGNVHPIDPADAIDLSGRT